MFFDGARNRVDGPRDSFAEVASSAARKFERFLAGHALDMRAFHARYGELICSAADPLTGGEKPSDLEVIVDTLPLLQDVDPEAEFVPVHIAGAVAGLPDGAPAPMLAVALNGVVAAITRPYAFPILGRRAAWEAIVDPGRLEPGANALEVFEVRGDPVRRIRRPGGGGRLLPRRCVAQPRRWTRSFRCSGRKRPASTAWSGRARARSAGPAETRGC